MDDEEWAISRSTARSRFDAPSTPATLPPQPVPALTDVTAWALAHVEDTLSSRTHPVAMFALEWCEFCWTLRRFFKRIGVHVNSIDLDAASWQAEGRGGQVRAAVHARTGQHTIPQVFVGGTWVGGCMDTLAAWRDGTLQKLLAENAVPFDADGIADPSELLPAWLQAPAR